MRKIVIPLAFATFFFLQSLSVASASFELGGANVQLAQVMVAGGRIIVSPFVFVSATVQGNKVTQLVNSRYTTGGGQKFLTPSAKFALDEQKALQEAKRREQTTAFPK